jgi:sigma-E factor negative regulatory protein RseB
MRAIEAGGARTLGCAPRWVGTVVAALAALASGAAWAQGSRAGAAGAEPARSASQWLQVIQAASRQLNYTGTIVFEQGGEVRSSRIVHYFDGTASHERLQMLDGKPREFIRRDDEVRCLYPESRRVLIERRFRQDAFPALGQAEPQHILQHYEVQTSGPDRVAGRDCEVLVIAPRDVLRYGYRLCVERASGLLLKAQTLDERGTVLEQMTFSEVRIGEPIDRSQLQPSWSTEGWQIERSEHQAADLAKSGWAVTPPPGFRKIKELARVLKEPADRERLALQAVFSDGLATLSVFIEPRSALRIAGEVAQGQGASHAHARRIGDALVTVVGEVPPATVRQVARAVERLPR